MPMMGVFNNLVLFDQHVPQNRVESIVPELATRWSWSEDGTELSFKVRTGVKWRDGTPFTAAELRLNYCEAWVHNIDSITTAGDREATFHLKRPQPALISLLALGLFAGLSFGARDAQPSDRYRALQIRRIQAQPVDQGGAQPGLL